MSDVESVELAPGIHRVETVADDGKLHGYHVLDGPSGPVLVDSGYEEAPTEVYRPFLRSRGQDLEDVSLALITHADADHFGGNRRLREHNPGVPIAVHRADAPLAESRSRILDRRYRKFESDHGIAYEDDIYEWLEEMMGPDEPVDIHLRGGEEFRVGDRTLTALHTPGHTRGHLVLSDEENDVVVGADAFFGRRLFDVDGNYLQPPPYYLYPEYETTTRLVESLDRNRRVSGEQRRFRLHPDDPISLDECCGRATPLRRRIRDESAVAISDETDRYQPESTTVVSNASPERRFGGGLGGFGPTDRLGECRRDERSKDRQRRDRIAWQPDVGRFEQSTDE